MVDGFVYCTIEPTFLRRKRDYPVWLRSDLAYYQRRGHFRLHVFQEQGTNIFRLMGAFLQPLFAFR